VGLVERGKGRGGGNGNSGKKKNVGDWKELTNDEPFHNPNKDAQFHEFVGINRGENAESVLEHFLLFFPMKFIDQITEQTNLFYKQEASKKTLPPFTVSNEDIMAFIAINITMGIARLPSVNDYWASGITSMPWFQSIMSRNRFKAILRFLHLSDKSKEVKKGEPGHDKLYKLGKIHVELSKIYSRIVSPSRVLSIDEQMVGTKSRCGFIQYMPKKPTRFGIKIWALCESLSGYCVQFQIYTGKEDQSERGLPYRVVFDLMSKYLGKGYQVYFDNFYTGYELVRDLAEKKTYSCGTIRSNRGKFSDEFIHAKLEKGKSIYLKWNNVLAVHWSDKKEVYLLSSFHKNGQQTIKRYNEEITKPDMICEYNNHMGGVDKCDQYMSYYSLKRKSLKW